MPVLTMPDGANVSFPDDMPKDQIRSLIEQKYPDAFKATPQAPQLSAGDTAIDALAGAGSGVTKGTLDMATIPAELASGAASVARKIGVPEDLISKAKTVAKYTPLSGQLLGASQAVRKLRQSKEGVAGAINAYADYKPESTVGKYAKSVGEFAPGAIGGGEGLGIRALKYAVAPGVASEAAGQLTEGTKLEPYARALGGLAGLGTGAGALNSVGEALARRGLETTQHFEEAGHNAYEAAKRANVLIKNSTVDTLKQGLSQHLDDIGFLPGSETKASAVLDRIYQDLDTTSSKVLAGRGAQTGFGQKPIALWELDKVGSRIMKKIKDLAPTDKGDRRVLWAAKHYIDDFAQGLGQNDIMAGDLPRGLQALADAKLNWKVKSKLNLLDQMEQNAQDTGHALYTRGGVEHANRKEFLKFLRKDPNKRQALTDSELEAFRRPAHGTVGGNIARYVGKLGSSATGNLFSGTAAATAGFFGGGPIGAAALGLGVPAISALGRLASRRSTQRAINDARSIIINRRPLSRGYKSKAGAILTLNELANQ